MPQRPSLPTTVYFKPELDAACDAALEAISVITDHRGRYTQDRVRSKATHDLVTEADVAAQEAITSVLNEAFPTYGLLGEEGDEEPTPDPNRPFWVVDPIDGTTNFAHDLGAFAISIGLVRDQEVVLGLIVDVDRDDWYVGLRGEGAFLGQEPLQVSTTATLDESLVAHGMPFRCVAHGDAYYTVLRTLLHRAQGQRRFGAAALDLAYLAAGRFDASFLVGIRPWDVAAGVVLVEEAGGQITTFSGDPYTITCPRIASTNGRVHADFVEVLTPLHHVVCTG